MLVLTRKENQSIYIGGQKLKVLEIHNSRVKYLLGRRVAICDLRKRQYFDHGYFSFDAGRYLDQIRVAIQAHPSILIIRQELKQRCRYGRT